MEREKVQVKLCIISLYVKLYTIFAARGVRELSLVGGGSNHSDMRGVDRALR